MIKNHYSTDIQSFKNALNLQGTSQEIKQDQLEAKMLEWETLAFELEGF